MSKISNSRRLIINQCLSNTPQNLNTLKGLYIYNHIQNILNLEEGKHFIEKLSTKQVSN
jgi:hypothetical protein